MLINSSLLRNTWIRFTNGFTFDAAFPIEGISSARFKASSKVKPFVNLIQVFRSKLEFISISDLLREVIEETGYVKELEAEGTDAVSYTHLDVYKRQDRQMSASSVRMLAFSIYRN